VDHGVLCVPYRKIFPRVVCAEPKVPRLQERMDVSLLLARRDHRPDARFFKQSGEALCIALVLFLLIHIVFKEQFELVVVDIS